METKVESLLNKYTEEERKEKLKEIYDKIKQILSKYMDMEEKNKEVIALWIIGTYMHDNFETFPYLFLNAMRGSGKTRALKIITKLAYKGNILISLTEAALFRTEGTLGVDEFENLGSKDKQALRELLNAGYKKGIGVIRMKKQKTAEGEEIVPERFECYRPIVMANIWGMEEVLGDRCISIILEKSNNPIYTRLIEDFEHNPLFEGVVSDISDVCEHKRTSIEDSLMSHWNNFITSHTSLTSLTSLTSQTSPQQEELQQVYDTNIDGRNLELYFPLIEIARLIDKDLFNKFLKIASESVESRRIDEISESKDVSMFQLVAGFEENKYYKIKVLVDAYRFLVGDNDNYDWLNARWMGRAVKRLNLITSKRKVREGSEVMLNVSKAKEKLEMFK